MHSNQIKWGSALSYIQMGLNILVNILYTPVMLRVLGQSEYGLYNMVSSTIATLSILNLGFSSSYIRFFSKYKVNNDEIGEAKLNGMFLALFSIIGLISFVCGIFLTFNIHSIFSSGLTSQEYVKAQILMILMTINLSISFPMSVFTSIITANEKYIFLKIINMISTIVSPLVILPVLFMGYKSVGMVVSTLILNLISYSLYIFYCKNKLHVKFIFKNMEVELFRAIFTFSLFIAINMIVDQINNNIDKILIARFKGTIEVAIYSIGATFNGYYMMFSTSVSGVFTPRIHRIVNINKHDPKTERIELTNLFVKVGRIQFFILSLIMTGIIFFGKDFINLWAGDGYEKSFYVALLLIVPATIPLCQNIGIEIQRAKNIHQFRSVIYLGMAIINLVASIFLCQKFGAVGSALGTSISIVIANIIIMNIFYYYKCNIDVLLFWKNIISILKGLVLPIIFGICITFVFDSNNLISLIIRIISYSIIYAVSIWLFSLNNYEKNLFRIPLRQLKGEINK